MFFFYKMKGIISSIKHKVIHFFTSTRKTLKKKTSHKLYSIGIDKISSDGGGGGGYC